MSYSQSLQFLLYALVIFNDFPGFFDGRVEIEIDPEVNNYRKVRNRGAELKKILSLSLHQIQIYPYLY